MSLDMSFEDHHYVVLLAVSASCAALHLASDVFNIMQDQTSLNGDLQTLCVASLRLMAFVASIILLEQTHNGPWIDFCVLASLLLLLVGESLTRAKVTPKTSILKHISVVVNTVAIGVRFFSAAAGLEMGTFAIFIFAHLFLEYGYSLLYCLSGTSTQRIWLHRFDMIRLSLCCATIATALVAVCIWAHWRRTILVVTATSCSICSLPFSQWISFCSNLGRPTEFVCETAARLESANTSPKSNAGWNHQRHLSNSNSAQQLRTATSFTHTISPERLRPARSFGEPTIPGALQAPKMSREIRASPGFMPMTALPQMNRTLRPFDAVPPAPRKQKQPVYCNDVVYPEHQQPHGPERWL
ncbi:hypothetical protein ABEF95_011953 [Exophiala dermatitidis]